MSKEKKSGRPRRNADEVLGQLTIRLSSKLKFGLELLARAQHRSLSQAVEWALQVGLNNYQVGEETVGSILDEAWKVDGIAARTLSLYEIAPGLLTFEESRTCELVDKSLEWYAAAMYADDAARQEIDPETAQRQQDAMFSTLDKFANLYWKQLMAAAMELANAGKSTSNVSLVRSLGFGLALKESFQLMERLNKHAETKDPAQAIIAVARERAEELEGRARLIESNGGPGVAENLAMLRDNIEKLREMERGAQPH